MSVLPHSSLSDEKECCKPGRQGVILYTVARVRRRSPKTIAVSKVDSFDGVSRFRKRRCTAHGNDGFRNSDGFWMRSLEFPDADCRGQMLPDVGEWGQTRTRFLSHGQIEMPLLCFHVTPAFPLLRSEIPVGTGGHVYTGVGRYLELVLFGSTKTRERVHGSVGFVFCVVYDRW